MNMGHKVAIAEALQIAQEGGHPSVNHHFIEHHLLIQVSVVVCKSQMTRESQPSSNKLSLCGSGISDHIGDSVAKHITESGRLM